MSNPGAKLFDASGPAPTVKALPVGSSKGAQLFHASSPAAAPAPAPAQHHGGGFLGGVLHDIGAAGHAVAHGVTTAADSTAGLVGQLGTGLYDLGSAEVGSIKQTVEHPIIPRSKFGEMWAHPFRPVAGTANTPAATREAKAVTVGTVTPLEHPLRNPVQTALSAFAVGSLGAGSLARLKYIAQAARVGELAPAEKAALIGKAASPLHTPPTAMRTLNVPKLVAPEGEGPAQLVHEPVQLQASGSHLGRGFQSVHDALVQRSLDRNVVAAKPSLVARYGEARVAGSLGEGSRIAQNLRQVPAKALAAAGGKFDEGVGRKVGQLAIFLRSANVTGAEAARYWAAQAARGVNAGRTGALAKMARQIDEQGLLRLNGDGNVEVAGDKFPRLANADRRTADAQNIRAGIIDENGLLPPGQMAERLDLVGRKIFGAKYVKPTPGKLGLETPGLKQARQRVASLSGRVAASAAGRVRTVPEAQARLAALEAEHEAALKQVSQGMFGKADRGETAFRNRENAKAQRQASGLTRDGRASGANGFKATARPTVTAENLAAAERAIHDAIARNPDHPVLARWAQRAQEIDQLRAALNPEFGAKINRRNLGTVGTPTDEARHAQLEGAVAVAQNDLARTEKAAATRAAQQTGIVGGDGFTRHGQGYTPLGTSEKRAPQSAVAVARMPVIGKVRSFVSSKRATGKGVETGNIPTGTTLAVAHALQQALRYVGTVEYRSRVARLGSDVRRTGNDVLVRDPEFDKQLRAAGEKARGAKVTDAQKQLLGTSRSTIDTLSEEEHVGLAAAIRQHLEDAIPGLKDEFAADKQAGLGTRAPNGYKWVPEQMLPGDLRRAATPRSEAAKAGDAINSAVTSATVYLKVGHLPTRAFTNFTTNVVQGSAAPLEVAKSARLVQQLSEDEKRELAALTGTHGYEALPHEGQTLVAKVASRGAGWWAKHVDAPFRINSVLYELRQIGITTPEQVRAALAQLKDPAREGMSAADASRLDWAVRRANRAAIMYDGLNDVEKRYLTRYMWFYPWTKAAVRFAGHTVVEHPVKAAVAGQIAGEGEQTQHRILGDVPSYELGLTPLSRGGDHPFTTDVSTFTPFGTIGQVSEMLAHPLSPDAGIVSQLNPGYAGLAALVQGKDLKIALSDVVQPTPEAQALAAALQPQGHGVFPESNHLLFGKTWESALARSLAGAAFPRRVNKNRLGIDARHEHQRKREITVYG